MHAARQIFWVGLVSLASAGAGASDAPPFGLGAFDREDPISIEADKLEASEQEGRRTLVFRKGVRVRQGPLELRAERLEAEYRAGESEPERLRADGNVRIREGDRRARCREAFYDRRGRQIVCRGRPAELFDGEDRLSGRKVVFDLERRSVRVDGGTAVEIRRELLDDPGGDDDDEQSELAERIRAGGPVTITARELEASESGGVRSILFRGDVEVQQNDLRLRSGELEALYPANASKPDRLLAREDVRIDEGDRVAECTSAEYRPADQHVTCQGNARLRDGADRLESDRIAFDFGARQVDATGNARLWVGPRDTGEDDR